jgi:hypothetical protein
MGALDKSPRKNWVEEQGGLPRYIERIAVHLVAKGMSTSHAIATAVNAAKHWCATGDVKQWKGFQDINPGSRSEACAAVAQWEKMKAAARAKRG